VRAASNNPDCFNGDRVDTTVSAFEKLYHTHGARMKSIAYNLLGNVADAEDAVQDAFVKACRGRERFRGSAQLSTWVYRILINTCNDMGRQRLSRRVAQTVELDESEPVAVASGDHPLRVTLERLVAHLSPRERQVFLLYEVEGFTHGEIAAMLDIAEGTSKAALFEAKRSIRAGLQSTTSAERRRP
jgi:RNA polymerase sigma-70 factor (ECF subfamily)